MVVEEVNHSTSSHKKGRERYAKKLRHASRQRFTQLELFPELSEVLLESFEEDQERIFQEKFGEYGIS